jgi:SAM-dependent methyltransferase
MCEGEMTRSNWQRIKDFSFFPLRAVTLFEKNRWGLTSLLHERLEYAAQEVQGHCLDVGCGKHNLFVEQFLGGHGRGIDVFRYDGLSEDHIVQDIAHFPFPDASFDSVTFIANLNHVPEPLRDVELAETYRCLKPGGNVIVTMGNPLAELLVHQVLWLHDRVFGTDYDLDGIRGMEDDEHYYVTDREIRTRLGRAGFRDLRKRFFPTQWGLNHLFVGWKR